MKHDLGIRLTNSEGCKRQQEGRREIHQSCQLRKFLFWIRICAVKQVNSFLTEGAAMKLLHCYLLPELQHKQEFLLQQASWRSMHTCKEKLWSNIKGEIIETERKIKIFLSLYVQLEEAQDPSPICPTPVQTYKQGSYQSLEI